MQVPWSGESTALPAGRSPTLQISPHLQKGYHEEDKQAMKITEGVECYCIACGGFKRSLTGLHNQ